MNKNSGCGVGWGNGCGGPRGGCSGCGYKGRERDYQGHSSSYHIQNCNPAFNTNYNINNYTLNFPKQNTNYHYQNNSSNSGGNYTPASNGGGNYPPQSQESYVEM